MLYVIEYTDGTDTRRHKDNRGKTSWRDRATAYDVAVGLAHQIAREHWDAGRQARIHQDPAHPNALEIVDSDDDREALAEVRLRRVDT